MAPSVVKHSWNSKLIRLGLGGLLLGSGPLLIAVVIADLKGDVNQNPIGPGILCALACCRSSSAWRSALGGCLSKIAIPYASFTFRAANFRPRAI